MSNKKWNNLHEIDRVLRRLFPTRMWHNNTTICTIRMFGGFELFNTRPYHNYEDWSEGYEISTEMYGGVKVAEEDLDDAVYKFAELINMRRAEVGEKPVDYRNTKIISKKG